MLQNVNEAPERRPQFLYALSVVRDTAPKTRHRRRLSIFSRFASPSHPFPLPVIPSTSPLHAHSLPRSGSLRSTHGVCGVLYAPLYGGPAAAVR